MQNQGVWNLYLDQLRDLYAAQRQLALVLPTLIGASTAPSLRLRLELHLEQTKGQLVRLTRIVEALGHGTQGRMDQGMAGLIRQIEAAQRYPHPHVRDLALIAAAQQFVQFELARYRAALTSARLLDQEDAALLLEASLREGTEAADKLALLAASSAGQPLRDSADGPLPVEAAPSTSAEG